MGLIQKIRQFFCKHDNEKGGIVDGCGPKGAYLACLDCGKDDFKVPEGYV